MQAVPSAKTRRRAVRLCEAEVRDADLLLYRRRAGDPAGQAICVAGRSDYCHVAIVAWELAEETESSFRVWVPRPLALQVVSWRGGIAPPLRDEVERWPGRIDWYGANDGDRWREFSRTGAVERMTDFVGCQYGWWSLWRVGLLHLAWLRWLVRPNLDDEANGSGPPFCSQAVATATRAGGVDPVRNAADRITEPGDLARSLFYGYRGTLVP